MDNRVWSLFRQAKRIRRLDSQTVTRAKLDDHSFDEMVERASLFRGAVEDRPQIEGEDDKTREYVPHWDDLMHDAFVSYHAVEEPSVLPQDAIKPSREANRRVMQQVLGTEDHRQTRAMTRQDPVASAFAAMSVRDRLIELLQGAMREDAEKAQEAGRLEDKIDSAQDAIDQIRQEIGDGPATAEQKQQMGRAAKRKSNAAKELAKLAAEMQDKPLNAAQANEINKAAKDGREAANIMASLPGMGKGAGKKLPPDDALRLAQMFRDNPILTKVAQMLGRLLRDMRFKRARRITGGREEVVDIELGANPALILPQELTALRHPLLRKDFYRRFYENSLLQYELRGTEEVGLGPLVVCVDSSGSMQGQKNVWAKAVTLAMIAIAHREKRHAAVVDFDTRTASWEFPHSAMLDPERVIEMTSNFFGGGTNIDAALTDAKGIIDAAPKFGRADIIVVSDGQSTFSQQSEKLKADFDANGIRVHGVQIGNAVSSYLNRMCDHTASAYDLAGANKATDMLATAVS